MHKIESVYIPPIRQRRWNRRKAIANALVAAGTAFVVGVLILMGLMLAHKSGLL